VVYIWFIGRTASTTQLMRRPFEGESHGHHTYQDPS
jgi:hypothetical protein